MKVVQLLIDGFHPDYTSELFDFDHAAQMFAGSVKLDSKMPRLKRLNSPYMWGRTLAGPDFPKTLSGYNPNHTNLQSAQDQGYLSIDPNLWIWNQMSMRGVKSFSFPYYLLEAVPTENIVPDSLVPNTLADLYLRDYTSRDYRMIDCRTINSHGMDVRYIVYDQVYHAICDNFDYNYGLDKSQIKMLKHTWDHYSPDNQSEFDDMIRFVRENLIPKVMQDLAVNNHIIDSELLYEMTEYLSSDEDFYVFLGFVESDAIEHYARPYEEPFAFFRAMMNSTIDKIQKKLKPDILIVHGDHNMVTAEHLDKPYKAEFDLNGKHHHAFKAGYNHFPMYCDHGNRVGGYVFYSDETYHDLVDELSSTDDLAIDRIRNWLLNRVFPLGR